MIKDYFKNSFSSDLKAGFITSIVALPLAIAFAIASGFEPVYGLYTAIIAGVIASSFAGSKFSITGPTGAMVVVIVAIMHKYGLAGVLLAGLMAGMIQIALGLAGLGKAVSYIPLPVISGFTAGIGGLIIIGQIGNSLGLTLQSREFMLDTIKDIITHVPEAKLAAIFVTICTFILLFKLPSILKKFDLLSNIPPSIVPLVLSVLFVSVFSPDIPIIGHIPSSFPKLSFFPVSLKLIKDVFPSAFTIAMLGSIEALLCAVVCDGMSGTKHDPNKELIAQGMTNMALPFFGGMPVTAAIARSAVNIKEGAKTNLSGVFHGLIILAFMLFFSPVISLIPKAFLAGILLTVAVRMIDIHEIRTIFHISRGEALVFSLTFILTVFTDLVFAVQVGMIAVSFLLFYRLTTTTSIENMSDHDKNSSWINREIEEDSYFKRNISVYTIYGPFFFGALNVFEKKVSEHVGANKPILLLRMRYVPFIDSSAIIRLRELIEDRKKEGKLVYLINVSKEVKGRLSKDKAISRFLKKSMFFKDTRSALDHIKKEMPI